MNLSDAIIKCDRTLKLEEAGDYIRTELKTIFEGDKNCICIDVLN